MRLAPAATILVALISQLAPTAAVAGPATEGTVVETFDADGHYTDGDGACGHPTEFVAPYAGQIVEQDDGLLFVLDQKDTDDVLVGRIDPETGIPPTLENPGKETAVEGRLDGGDVVYRYRYTDRTGCTATWLVRFVVLSGSLLPYLVALGPEVPTAPVETTAPSTTAATPAPTTASDGPAGPVAAPIEAEPASDGGGDLPWVLLALGLAALVVVSGVRWLASTGTAPPAGGCDEELRAWNRAEAEAQRTAARASGYESRADRLAKESSEAWTDLQAGTVDQAYVDQVTSAAFNADAMAKSAQAEADAAAAAAEAARQAYLACIGQGEPAAVDGGATTTGGGTDPAGATVGGHPAHVGTAVSGGPCRPGDPPPEPPQVVEEPETLRVPADFHILVVPAGWRPGTETADSFHAALGDLATDLGILGGALSGGKAAGSLLAGNVGKAAVGGAGIATGVPTSLQSALIKVAGITAKAGSTITGEVAEWNKGNDFYAIDARTYDVDVTLTWTHSWTCVDGQWTCGESLSVTRGPLELGTYHIDGHLESPEDRFHFRKDKIDGEVARVVEAMQAKINAGWKMVAEKATPSERPCTIH